MTTSIYKNIKDIKDKKRIIEKLFLKEKDDDFFDDYMSLKESIRDMDFKLFKKSMKNLNFKNSYSSVIENKKIVFFNAFEFIFENIKKENIEDKIKFIEFTIKNVKDEDFITDREFDLNLIRKKNEQNFDVYMELMKLEKKELIKKIITESNKVLFIKKNPSVMMCLLESKHKRSKNEDKINLKKKPNLTIIK